MTAGVLWSNARVVASLTLAWLCTACSDSSSISLTYFTPPLVVAIADLAGATAEGSPSSTTSALTGDGMPLEALRYFQACQGSDQVFTCVPSKYAIDPTLCQGKATIYSDGSLIGSSCQLDSWLHEGTSGGDEACADAKGLTVTNVQALPFLAQWPDFPAAVAFQKVNIGSNGNSKSYYGITADPDRDESVFVRHDSENGFPGLTIAYRNAVTHELAFVYFRTQDSGSPNINVTALWGNSETLEFEAYGTGEASPSTTTRLLSRGGRTFLQTWTTNQPSGTPDRPVSQSPQPNENGTKCYANDSQTEVPMSECESAIGGTDFANGSHDELFRLKLLDWQAQGVALGQAYYAPEAHNVFSGNVIPTAGCQD